MSRPDLIWLSLPMIRSPALSFAVVLPALAALGALSGCATVQATLQEDTAARSETLDYVHQRPLDEVWPAVRAVLDDHGFSILEGERGHYLATEWKLMADSVWIAYVVEGYRRPGHTSLVRMFRIQRMAKSTARPPADWNRMYKGLNVGLTGDPEHTMENQVDGSDTDDDPLMSRTDLKRPTMFEVGEGYRADRDARMEREVIERAAPADAAKMAKLLKMRMEREEQRRAPPAPVEDEAARQCGGAVPGAEALLRPGAVVVLGEQYGTSEIPGFVGRLACVAARRGVPVQIGVEMPVVEARRLQWYLDQKDPEAKSRLMGGLFWARPQQDGRSSAAVLELIDRATALRAEGLPVSVFPFDVHNASGNAREQAMASNVLEVRKQHPESAVLVLTGNVHARTTRGVPWDGAFVPMGSHLAAQAPGTVVLDAHYAGGEAWQCKLGAEGRVVCDRFKVEPPVRKLPTVFMGELAPNRVTLFEAPEADGGFHGVFYVGVLSASPPATSILPAATRPPAAPASASAP
jgi:hypothetical protein